MSTLLESACLKAKKPGSILPSFLHFAHVLQASASHSGYCLALKMPLYLSRNFYCMTCSRLTLHWRLGHLCTTITRALLAASLMHITVLAQHPILEFCSFLISIEHGSHFYCGLYSSSCKTNELAHLLISTVWVRQALWHKGSSICDFQAYETFKQMTVVKLLETYQWILVSLLLGSTVYTLTFLLASCFLPSHVEPYK